MAIATYNTDLNDIDTCEAIGTWTELTGHTSGGAASVDGESYIQGSNCISQSTGTKTGIVCGLEFDYGSDVSGSMTAGDCFFFWQIYLAAANVYPFASGGLRVGVGSSAGNMNFWKTGGNDFGRYPYGGWQNFAIDPVYTPDYIDGTPTGAYQFFGSLPNIIKQVSKGNPHGVDAIRYGRGEIYIQGGESGAYGTFSGIAAANDTQLARWGLFQAQGTGYLWKGLISLGTSTHDVDFRDSNANITIDDTPRTYAEFNKIEINYPSTNVEWTGVAITSLNASGLSIGQLEVIDSTAQVNFNTCTFTDMNTFIFELGCDINLTTFRRCGQVTQGGGIFDGCTFEESSAEVSLLVDDLDNIENCSFISDGSNHGIRLTEDHADNTYTLTGCKYTGYSATDGDTGNECIFNDSTGHVIINVIGGDVPTIRNGLGASTALPTSVTLTMTVKDEAGDVIVGAFAYIDDDDIVPYIMNTTTNASGIATVQHTGGVVNDSSWRVRKYGFKAYRQTVDIAGDNISLPITLISDPQQT